MAVHARDHVNVHVDVHVLVDVVGFDKVLAFLRGLVSW